MRPIQVWLPTFNSSWADPVFELDVQRAFQEWSGELTIWFVPMIEKPYRWKEGENPWDWILAGPAGRWERVDVYHVNERGHVWGLCAGVRFPNGSVDGLLETWLNVLKNHGCHFSLAPFSLAPSTLTWKEPSILELPPKKEGEERIGVKYTETTFSLHPCDMLAFKKIGAIDQEKILVEAVWPPAGQPGPTISLARASQMYFGPLEGYEQDGLRLVRHGDNPDSPGIHFVLRWDEPLQSLFPIGADSDTLFHQGKMVDIAR